MNFIICFSILNILEKEFTINPDILLGKGRYQNENHCKDEEDSAVASGCSVCLGVCLPMQVKAQEETVQTEADASVTSAAVQKKQGLVREGRNYCYYVKGQKVRRAWKKIRGRKYYFGNNGNAVTGSVQIKGTYYIFNEKGQLH